MPPASRFLDVHACPAHGGAPIVTFSPDVIIGFRNAGRQFDILSCVPPDMIVEGSPTVFINHRQAARITDPTAHSGKLATGFPTVFIGETGQGFTLSGASAQGQPFCEECEKARRAQAQHDVPTPPAELPEPPPIPPTRLRGVSDAEVQLAAEEGSSQAQIDARKKVAVAFFEQHAFMYERGTQKPIPHPPAQLRSELAAIDYTRPVSFGPPPALPPTLDQLQVPGWDQGQYYAAAGTPAEQIGILPYKELRDGRVDKKPLTYDMNARAPYLKTTAAATDDTWDVPGQAIPVQGGATQYYMPDRAYATVTK